MAFATLEEAVTEAARRNLPFAWRLQTVPGIGHSNAGMAPAAADLLF